MPSHLSAPHKFASSSSQFLPLNFVFVLSNWGNNKHQASSLRKVIRAKGKEFLVILEFTLKFTKLQKFFPSYQFCFPAKPISSDRSSCAFPQPFLKSVEQVLCTFLKSVHSSFIPQVAKNYQLQPKSFGPAYFKRMCMCIFITISLNDIPVLQMPACTNGDPLAPTTTSSMRFISFMHQQKRNLHDLDPSAATLIFLCIIFIVLSN